MSDLGSGAAEARSLAYLAAILAVDLFIQLTLRKVPVHMTHKRNGRSNRVAHRDRNSNLGLVPQLGQARHPVEALARPHGDAILGASDRELRNALSAQSVAPNRSVLMLPREDEDVPRVLEK